MKTKDVVTTDNTTDAGRVNRTIRETRRILSTYKGREVTRDEVLTLAREACEIEAIRYSRAASLPVSLPDFRRALATVLNATVDTRVR